MNLYELFFDEKRRSTALIGGGGKTTLLAGIAEAADRMNRPLVLSTSTKLQRPCPVPSAALFENPSPPDDENAEAGKPPLLWVSGKTPAGDKWTGPPIKVMESFISRQDSGGKIALLIEADGSAGRPIKTPGPQEPVIPVGTDTVAAVIGISAIGRPLSERTVHRLEPFLTITGASPGDTITPQMLVRLILHPRGSFKGCDSGMRRILIINQADTPTQVLHARLIAEAVTENLAGASAGGPLNIEKVLITALRKDYKIWSIINT